MSNASSDENTADGRVLTNKGDPVNEKIQLITESQCIRQII